MARTKRALKRKPRKLALPIFGAAGMSLAMAGGTSATAPTVNVPSQDKARPPVITFSEEEISDVSLATFFVFDKENESQLGQNLKLAARGCGRGCGGCRGCGRGCAGCRGCGGCGCGGCGCGGGLWIGACVACGGGCSGCFWRWSPRLGRWIYAC